MQELRNRLFQEAKRLRERGKVAHVRRDVLIVDDKRYTWCQKMEDFIPQDRDKGGPLLRRGNRYNFTIERGADGTTVSAGKITCWNVAGVFSKNREFWTFVLTHDVIILLETWMEQKSERSFLTRLSTEFEWTTLPATRTHKKERAKGGQLVGIRKQGGLVWRFADWKYGIIIFVKHRDKRQDDIIVSAYCNEDLNSLSEDLANVLEEATRTGAQLLLIGDFNARIGLENVTTEKDDAIIRKSEDELLNFEEKKLLTFCDNNALKILNGCSRGDYTGKFTFIGALGASVIDYAIVKDDNSDISLDVLARTELDHLPLVMLGWSSVLQPSIVSAPRVRWCWDKTVAAAFAGELDRELQEFIVNDNDRDLSNLVVYLNERMQRAATTAEVKRSGTRWVEEHWFDRECKKRGTLDAVSINFEDLARR
uniref:Endonuclease/exonuclease/phosphatase domain-containing protein n=1 Tax=Strigamia maritima TaxID=126957 RepID=T1INJ8_STRMM